MSSDQTFGLWLRSARRTRDLTREALAELVSCATSTLAKIEQGTRRPSRELAALLVEALQPDPAERARIVQLARQPIAELPEDAELPGAPDEPPRRAAPRPELPSAATPLIGRASELALLRRRLADPTCRVLTLVGTGGVGKTRLALQATIEAAPHYADGAAWVELAPLRSADQLAATIAEAVGCGLSGAETAEQRLLAFLRDRQLLLALDNLEHLLDAAPLLTTLTRQAPHVTLLLTSRERLRLQGEWVVEVGGLGLPDARPGADLEHAAAAQLFLARAHQVAGAIVLSAAGRQAVAQICRMLEGLPLGIELAAAWAATLSYQEIAEELARGLDLLARADRDAPARHRSMRAVFEHSWRLLSPAAQQTLARLSVFRGGCGRAAAQQVAGASLATLAALLDASLLRRSEAGGRTRYDLHELVRQYAAEQLAADPVAERDARERHAAYFTDLLAASLPELQSGAQAATLTTLDVERANIRQAWDRLVQQGNLAALRRASLSLLLMFELRDQLRESAELFGQAVAALRATQARTPLPDGAQTLGVLLSWEGWGRGRSGEVQAAIELLRESAALLASDEDLLAQTGTLGYLGMMLYQVGQLTEARACVERNLALIRPRSLAFFESLNSTYLTYIALAEGAYDEARATAAAAVRAADASGSQRARVLSRCLFALQASARGDAAQTEQWARDALQLSAIAHDRFGITAALLQLGHAAMIRGDLEEAHYLFHESSETFAEIGDRWNVGRSLLRLGAVEQQRGALAEAQRIWREVLRMALAQGTLPLGLTALLGIAGLLADAGQATAAYPLLLAISRHAAADAATRSRAEQLRATLATALPADALAAAERQAAAPLDLLAAPLLDR